MDYQEIVKIMENIKFCDPVRSPNLAYDLSVLKVEVLPALKKRIQELEEALQKSSENLFKKDNEFNFEV